MMTAEWPPEERGSWARQTTSPGTAQRPASARRVLVAGIGNVLRGDDGFGPAVVDALRASGLPAGVRVVEVGIGGIALVHELMDGYDGLVLVDAVERGGAPGMLYTLEPLVPDLTTLAPLEQRALAADMHSAVPTRALLLASAAGVLPPLVRLIGCQPAAIDDFSLELSPCCRQGVASAVAAIHGLLAEWLQPGGILQGGGQHDGCA